MAKPSLVYNPKFTVFDNSGVPVSGAKVFVYQAGTTTKLTTYPTAADASAGTNANANPMIANSAGQIGDMYVTQSCKLVACPSTDTDPPSNPYWTEDNLTTLGQTITTVTKTTTYTVTASDRDKLFKVDASAGNVTLNLPTSASAGDGFRIEIMKIDSSGNSVIITPNGSENLNGSNSSITNTSQYTSYTLTNDSTQWFSRFNNSNTTASGLTVASGKTLTVNNTLTLTGTDSSSVAFGTGGTVLYSSTTTDFSGSVGFTGFSANPAVSYARYLRLGKLCYISIILGGGTSNSTSFTITGLPFTSASTTQTVPAFTLKDNGSYISNGFGQISSGTTTITLGYNQTLNNFTSSGSKSASLNFWYETT